MSNYQTPGVYVEEISTLAPSVAAVSTAIPAFIGLTEKAKRETTNDLELVPTKVNSIYDYVKYFGKGQKATIAATIEEVVKENGYKLESMSQMGIGYNTINGVETTSTVGSGYGLTVDITIDGTGKVTGVTIKTAGTDYATNDEITINGGTTKATYKVINVSGVGTVTELEIIEHGSGYNTIKGVETTSTVGSGLTVDITIDGKGEVTDVTIKTAGTDYATNDEITIKGGTTRAKFKIQQLYEFVSRSVTTRVTEPSKKYYMYESIKLYFDNGGGPCYVISVGDHADSLNSTLLKTGLDELAKEDEPTLIVFPDIYASKDLTIYNDALAQCHKLQDRFLIMDVKSNNTTETDASNFRTALISEYLQYGAAYYPSLKTTLSYHYDLSSKSIDQNFKDASGNDVSDVDKDNYTAGCYFRIENIEDLKDLNRGVYNTIIAEANKTTITLPSSGAVAGVYAQTDRNRGVWKAPANIALNKVVAPAIKITDATQGGLNIDTTGKSINAIRSFTGKGTLVWGARTLDGNSNEWRYIQVRRLFNYVEESIKKSTSWAVFEANDANTHIRVKAQIESFLTGVWRAGGLVGASVSEAFFVNVGLGNTLTPQDVLEGKMNVEIGLAASRPAEFIILKFSHFIQQS